MATEGLFFVGGQSGTNTTTSYQTRLRDSFERSCQNFYLQNQRDFHNYAATMVGIHAAAICVLTLWATLSLTTAKGAGSNNIIDPSTITQRRLRNGQAPTQQQQQSVNQEKNRSKRLGATASSSSSSSASNPQRNLQDEACVLQGNLFGNFDGNFRNVEFLYQGVFAEGTSQTQINLNILPSLEREIVTGILPAWFACPEPTPTGLVNGISPSDTELAVGGTYIHLIFPTKRRRDSHSSLFLYLTTNSGLSKRSGRCLLYLCRKPLCLWRFGQR